MHFCANFQSLANKLSGKEWKSKVTSKPKFQGYKNFSGLIYCDMKLTQMWELSSDFVSKSIVKYFVINPTKTTLLTPFVLPDEK